MFIMVGDELVRVGAVDGNEITIRPYRWWHRLARPAPAAAAACAVFLLAAFLLVTAAVFWDRPASGVLLDAAHACEIAAVACSVAAGAARMWPILGKRPSR